VHKASSAHWLVLRREVEEGEVVADVNGQPTRRILIVTTAPQTIKGFLLPFARHLRERGWHVEAATGRAPMTDELLDEFERVWQVPWSREVSAAGNVRAFAEIRQVMERGHFDIVHVHTPIASVVTRAAAASLGRNRPRIVYTAHGFHFYEGGDPMRNRAFSTIERFAGHWTDREIVINDEDFAQAISQRVIPSARLRLFPGIGIDLDHYAPTEALQEEAQELRSRLGLGDEDVLYTMLAEFIPRKNHLAAVEGFLRAKDPNAHLAFAGAGPTEPDVRDRVEAAGLTDRVHFLGLVSDVRPLILASDATLLPSRQEGLSRAVLESLAVGVPVVGGRTRGIRDLVDDDLGILVEPDDVDGLAQAMTAILDFPSRGDLRARSRDRLEAYSLPTIIQLHDELYDELTGRAGGANV
jgi:glycosyltransferase involved in cell wall biosynthesis